MKLCLVGGFLGSGKTTAIVTAGKMLLKKKISVAIITNDQGSQLVDAAFTNSMDIPNSEIKNGCYCCNYEQFYLAIQQLNNSVHPDIIFAEAVGSCSDLVATVAKPLRRFHPEIEIVFSVFADGAVLLSLLEGRASFINENIQYIYKKQLEEAGILIVNKSDMLDKKKISKITRILESEYSGRKILFQDSRNEMSIQGWLDVINEKKPHTIITSLDIDYEKYAAGEAALAWLDTIVKVHSKRNAVDKSFEFMNGMASAISHQQLPVGHVKFLLETGNWQKKISYTMGGSNMDHDSRDNKIAADHATILVNARVETNPGLLKRIFFQAIRKIEDQNCNVEVIDLAAFQPGYPRPTYRFAE